MTLAAIALFTTVAAAGAVLMIGNEHQSRRWRLGRNLEVLALTAVASHYIAAALW